ncbi:FAD-dependent oxidoreductase [Sorangium sp. So ce327]|uniref:FAD-dependent oxidoreductase n=1 Tax=Sorangium sp. So ce327 TaxID=3133301 RepID=UPI003F606A49
MNSGKVDDESLVESVVPAGVTRSATGEAGNGDVSRRDFLQAGALLGAAIVAPGCATASGAAVRPTNTPERSAPPYDVVIVGGGPGGLAAALTLGRSRRRVLLCDSGSRRNAAAEHIHNFVTRDGTSPEEFRRIGREQLAAYPSVDVQDVRVVSVSGARDAFQIGLTSGVARSRRVLLCTGMLDERLPIQGFDELWGHAIFQCPYCHGWEVQDQRWGYLVTASDAQMLLPFALQARGWTRDVVVFTSGTFDVPAETRARLRAAGISIETDPVRRFITRERRLEAVELSTGSIVPCAVIFTHPAQRQVELVGSLGLTLDEHGYVRADPMRGETSMPGVYAAGDLTTRMQGAIWAAAAGARAAAMINVDLAMSAASGELGEDAEPVGRGAGDTSPSVPSSDR